MVAMAATKHVKTILVSNCVVQVTATAAQKNQGHRVTSHANNNRCVKRMIQH
jgi:hypothetical protein